MKRKRKRKKGRYPKVPRYPEVWIEGHVLNEKTGQLEYVHYKV